MPGAAMVLTMPRRASPGLAWPRLTPPCLTKP